MGHKPPSGEPALLGELERALAAALELSQKMADDPLLGRIIAVFGSMPSEDRAPILGILEREVAGRLLSRATEKPVGQSTHLNPNARLYVRAHTTELHKRHFDYDEMLIADIRGMRIAYLIRHVPEIYTAWKAAIREAMDHVDEGTRAVAEELLQDVLAAIADARAVEAAAEPADDGQHATERSRKP